jgi:hypothetical protein
MSHRESDWVSLYRMNSTKLLDLLAAFAAQDEEYVALDYGNTLDQEDDFIGENAEIQKADLVAAVTSVNAIRAFVTSNFHHTNLYKVRE